jgi:hypothetical protein
MILPGISQQLRLKPTNLYELMDGINRGAYIRHSFPFDYPFLQLYNNNYKNPFFSESKEIYKWTFFFFGGGGD